MAQAHIDLNRAETLWRQGAGPRATLDQARTALDVAQSSLNARIAERDVARQQLQEGDVLAPVAGRVLTVPLTRGSVVMNGDNLATIGEQPFTLRLRIPERHAVTLKVGDSIRIDAQQLGAEHGARGTITLIYPHIEEGRVVADAQVDRLGDYFVGDRIRVWITAGSRPGFVIPPDYVTTRFGLDYVSLRTATGIIATPVQRGGRTPDGLEILSGLRAGDVLAQP